MVQSSSIKYNFCIIINDLMCLHFEQMILNTVITLGRSEMMTHKTLPPIIESDLILPLFDFKFIAISYNSPSINGT